MDTHASSTARTDWRACRHTVTAIVAPPYADLAERAEVRLLLRVLAGLRGLPDE